MRTKMKAEAGIERTYIEAHITSVMAIGLDYDFDIVLLREPSYTRIALKQFYRNSPRMIDSVEIIFYYDHPGVEINRTIVMANKQENADRVSRSDHAIYNDYGAEALDHIMRIVWDIETD